MLQHGFKTLQKLNREEAVNELIIFRIRSHLGGSFWMIISDLSSSSPPNSLAVLKKKFPWFIISQKMFFIYNEIWQDHLLDIYFFWLYDWNSLGKHPFLNTVPNIINLTWETSNWQTFPKLKLTYGKLPEKSTRILKNP